MSYTPAQLAIINSGNSSVNPTPPAQVQQIFNTQQALTQALGARAAQVFATPSFVAAKSTVAPNQALNLLNTTLNQQGVYVTTPELKAFNNAIQNVPLSPNDQSNVNNLLNRLNSPLITSGSTSSNDLYNFLVRHGALNPNPTPNTTTVQASPSAGGGYQPPTNQPQVTVPAGFPNLPLGTPNLINPINIPTNVSAAPQGYSSSSGQLPQLPPITLNLPTIPQSAGTTNQTPSGGSVDIMTLLSNPIVLIALVAVVGGLIFVFARRK